MNRQPGAGIISHSLGTKKAATGARLPHLYSAKSNKGELSNTIAYLSHLYQNGEISEKAFESLVKHACLLFVEAEIERKLSTYLEQKLLYLLEKFTSDNVVLELLGNPREDV